MAGASELKVLFQNDSGVADENIHIGFYAALKNPTSSEFSITNLNGGGPIKSIYDGVTKAAQHGNWYKLSALVSGAGGGVNMRHFSGRIYVCYGTPWAPYPGNVSTPGQSLADGNFFLRFDKLEATFNGAAADVADLTSIDFWAIPMSLKATYKGAEPAGIEIYQATGLIGATTPETIYKDLLALTAKPVSGIAPQRGQPFAAHVPGSFAPKLTQFARLTGPQVYGPIYPPGFPILPYDTLEKYLKYLLAQYPSSAPLAAIQGTYEGTALGKPPKVPKTGPQSPHTYDLKADISKDLTITLTGTVTPKAAGPSVPKTLTFHKDALLNPAGIYGCNLRPGNDLDGWIAGDLTMGLTIGAIGSTAIVGGTAVGQMPSASWYNLSKDQLYASLQPTKPELAKLGLAYYNQWAATLTPLSDAYNFPYNDRLSKDKVLVSLDPKFVDTLAVTLESALVPNSPITLTLGGYCIGVNAAGTPVLIEAGTGAAQAALWEMQPLEDNSAAFQWLGNGPAGGTYLAGDTATGQVSLAANTGAGNTGAHWGREKQPGGAYKLQCGGAGGGANKVYLQGDTASLGLTLTSSAGANGVDWQLNWAVRQPSVALHSPVATAKHQYLQGSKDGSVTMVAELAASGNPTHWREIAQPDGTIALECAGLPGTATDIYLSADSASLAVSLSPEATATHWVKTMQTTGLCTWKFIAGGASYYLYLEVTKQNLGLTTDTKKPGIDWVVYRF